MLGPNPLAHPMAPNPQELATARANAEHEGREGAAKQGAREATKQAQDKSNRERGDDQRPTRWHA